MGEQIAGEVHQVAVQQRHRTAARACDGLLQCGDMGMLTRVQFQSLGRMEQCSGLRGEDRIEGHREQPGFPDMCHREIRRGLARGFKQGNRIAVHKVVGAQCLIIERDGLGGGTRYGMSLRVREHGLHL